MSSWQAYVDSSLMAGGALSSACLIGKDNAQIWGQTPGFGPQIYNASVSVEDASGNISEVQQQVNESVDLVNYVKTKKKSAAGFRINGVKYTTVRTFQENEYGFFTVYGAKGAGSGCCLVATNKAIIIGVWDKKVNPAHIAASCNSTVEELGKYLKGAGY